MGCVSAVLRWLRGPVAGTYIWHVQRRVSPWHVLAVWLDSLQPLRRWSVRIDNERVRRQLYGHLSCRHVLAVWFGVVQQLLCWSVRLGCGHGFSWMFGHLPCRHVQSRWCDVVQQLQCRSVRQCQWCDERVVHGTVQRWVCMLVWRGVVVARR